MFRDVPIKRKLMVIILLTSAMVLLVTCASFFTYDFFTFRQAMTQHLYTLGKMIAANSTAALAFENQTDAQEVLSALQAEPHIVSACLYDRGGKLFALYPTNAPPNSFPASPEASGHRFGNSYLEFFHPVAQGGKPLGTLYLKSDVGAMQERVRLYALIVASVAVGSFLLAYLLSRILQRQISKPVLALAATAKAVSERQDYSVRAVRQGADELGFLTDAFNDMLEQIHNRDLALQTAQRELKLHATELEKRVAERTVRLSETVAELESFSYSVSHDLRAPLRAMRSYAQIILDDCGDKLDPEFRNYAVRIVRSAERLDKLIVDVLAYSRVSRADFKPSAVNLDKLIPDILEQYPQLQSETSRIQVDGPLLPVLGHDALLTQCFSNLLGNAIKFVPKGTTARVRIWTEKIGAEVRVWVEDNGIGIAPEHRHRVFQIFGRVHHEREYEGTGIGLAVVKKAVERMRGSVGFESTPGTGSRFWIQLPAADT